jgi:hypothetical protein
MQSTIIRARPQKHCRCLDKKVLQVIGVESDVIQSFRSVKAKARSDSQKPFRLESSLRVDVEALAFCSTLIDGQLTSYGECVAELSFSCA